MTAIVIRILLRYGAAALVAHGWLTADAGTMLGADPDVQMLIGLIIGFGVEGWHYLAQKLGWAH